MRHLSHNITLGDGVFDQVLLLNLRFVKNLHGIKLLIRNLLDKVYFSKRSSTQKLVSNEMIRVDLLMRLRFLIV